MLMQMESAQFESVSLKRILNRPADGFEGPGKSERGPEYTVMNAQGESGGGGASNRFLGHPGTLMQESDSIYQNKIKLFRDARIFRARSVLEPISTLCGFSPELRDSIYAKLELGLYGPDLVDDTIDWATLRVETSAVGVIASILADKTVVDMLGQNAVELLRQRQSEEKFSKRLSGAMFWNNAELTHDQLSTITVLLESMTPARAADGAWKMPESESYAKSLLIADKVLSKPQMEVFESLVVWKAEQHKRVFDPLQAPFTGALRK